MTPYDAVMLGVVVAGMVWGAWRGITWQVASIASLVLGYLFAHPLSAQIAPHLPGQPVVARALSMLVVYVIVSGGVFLAAWVIRTTLRKMKFEAYDRHLGMVLGGLEGCMLGVVGTLFVVSLAPQTRAPIFQSRTGRVVGGLMDAVGPVLPTEVRQALAPVWSNADEAVAARSEAEGRKTFTSSIDSDEPAPPAQRPGSAGWKPWKDRPDAVSRRDLAPSKLTRSADDDVPAIADNTENLTARVRSRVGRAAGEALERGIKETDLGRVDADGQVRTRVGRSASDALERTIKDGNVNQVDAEGADDLATEIRTRVGRAAGDVLERKIEQSDLGRVDADGQIRARVGQAAGQVLERGITQGAAPDLKNLYQEGRSRLGRAAAEVIEQELRKVGNADGQDRNPGGR